MTRPYQGQNNVQNCTVPHKWHAPTSDKTLSRTAQYHLNKNSMNGASWNSLLQSKRRSWWTDADNSSVWDRRGRKRPADRESCIWGASCFVLFAIVRESEGKRPFGRPRRIWDNIKMDIKKRRHDIEVQQRGAVGGLLWNRLHRTQRVNCHCRSCITQQEKGTRMSMANSYWLITRSFCRDWIQ